MRRNIEMGVFFFLLLFFFCFHLKAGLFVYKKLGCIYD